MKILAIEHDLPGKAVEKFHALAKAEARRVWDWQQSGVVREAYFRTDRDEAVLVLECESAEDAREVLATLPFVQAQLITFEIMPLKAYPGTARLFGEGSAEGAASHN